jgi:hypothetical protein
MGLAPWAAVAVWATVIALLNLFFADHASRAFMNGSANAARSSFADVLKFSAEVFGKGSDFPIQAVRVVVFDEAPYLAVRRIGFGGLPIWTQDWGDEKERHILLVRFDALTIDGSGFENRSIARSATHGVFWQRSVLCANSCERDSMRSDRSHSMADVIHPDRDVGVKFIRPPDDIDIAGQQKRALINNRNLVLLCCDFRLLVHDRGLFQINDYLTYADNKQTDGDNNLDPVWFGRCAPMSICPERALPPALWWDLFMLLAWIWSARRGHFILALIFLFAAFAGAFIILIWKSGLYSENVSAVPGNDASARRMG